MSLAPLYRHALAIGSSSLLAFLLSALPAHAADCRTLNSVIHSANLGNNARDGGHVAGHVRGQPAPPAPPIWDYTGKDQFLNAADYQRAWNAFAAANLPQAPDCKGQGPTVRKTVSISQLPLFGGNTYAGAVCNDRTCTAPRGENFSNFQFDFYKGQNGWILNTAYPIP